MEREVTSAEAMQDLGRQVGALLVGGETVELVGDIGAGKTTLTKGIADALGVKDEVQSPTFTLSRTYQTKSNGYLVHYDFYRLTDPGILSAELEEATRSDSIVVIEWANVVSHVLPDDRLTIVILPTNEDGRKVEFKASGPRSQRVLEKLS